MRNKSLNFNAKGFLIPNINISSICVELETEFVINIHSARRKHLFDNYMKYANSLKNELAESSLSQWVDGSLLAKRLNLVILMS